jgi:hypothetical protein
MARCATCWTCTAGCVPGTSGESDSDAVSPAARNVATLQQSGLSVAPATSQNIRTALSALHQTQGDLLVIFWTGHGFITDKRHRLVVADATDDDQSQLRSRRTPGLAREQLFPRASPTNSDCWTRVLRTERFAFTTPSVELPQGDPYRPNSSSSSRRNLARWQEIWAKRSVGCSRASCCDSFAASQILPGRPTCGVLPKA